MREGSRKETKAQPLCRQCRHYFITWQPDFPHGCHAFGFKSRLLPYLEVRSASQLQCLKFQKKVKNTPR